MIAANIRRWNRYGLKFFSTDSCTPYDSQYSEKIRFSALVTICATRAAGPKCCTYMRVEQNSKMHMHPPRRTGGWQYLDCTIIMFPSCNSLVIFSRCSAALSVTNSSCCFRSSSRILERSDRGVFAPFADWLACVFRVDCFALRCCEPPSAGSLNVTLLLEPCSESVLTGLSF